MRIRTFAVVLALTVTTAASARDVDPALRQLAIDNCRDDAMRLCPLAMTDEPTVVACMSDRRDDLGPTCRAVYDRIVRVLAQ